MKAIPVTATDASGNAGSITNTTTFTANGFSTILAYDLSGNQTLKSNASSVLTFGWDGANRRVFGSTSHWMISRVTNIDTLRNSQILR